MTSQRTANADMTSTTLFRNPLQGVNDIAQTKPNSNLLYIVSLKSCLSTITTTHLDVNNGCCGLLCFFGIVCC